MKSNHLSQAWLVIVLAASFGGALAGVELALRERIAENKRNEMLHQVPVLVPESTHGEIDDTLSKQYGKIVAKALNKENKVVGYVIVASGDGFADKIELLVGLDPNAHIIRGMYVLSQKETPELGNKIVKSEFRDQFQGQSITKSISANKEPQGNHQVEAISGATISSVAVCSIINKGVTDFRKILFEMRKKSETETEKLEGGIPDGE